MPVWSLIKIEEKIYISLEGGRLRKPNGDLYGNITSCGNGRATGQLKFMFSNSKMGRNLCLNDFRGMEGQFSECFTTVNGTITFQRKLMEMGIPRTKPKLLGEREIEPSTSKRPRLTEIGAEKILDYNYEQPLEKSSFASKSKGVFKVRANFLEQPPEELLVRKRRPEWIQTLKRKIKCSAHKMQTTIPVMVDPESMMEQFCAEKIPNYRLWILGGNHLVQAVKELMLEFPNDQSFVDFSVEVFVDVTKEEARKIANQHNAKSETLPVTFQDKVRQARVLKDEGVENLSTAVADMLSDIMLKHVARSSCTLLVHVCKYSQQNYSLCEEIFNSFEDKYGIGKSVPEKLFRTLQSPAFSEKDIHFYLSRARETGLRKASVEAEESRKRKVVKNTFRESVQAATWEEAVDSFPNHTKEATLESFCDYPQSQTMIPKPLAQHINSALKDLPPPVNIQDTIEVVIRRNGKTITTTEMTLISNQVKIIKRKLARHLPCEE